MKIACYEKLISFIRHKKLIYIEWFFCSGLECQFAELLSYEEQEIWALVVVTCILAISRHMSIIVIDVISFYGAKPDEANKAAITRTLTDKECARVNLFIEKPKLNYSKIFKILQNLADPALKIYFLALGDYLETPLFKKCFSILYSLSLVYCDLNDLFYRWDTLSLLKILKAE